MKTINTLLLLIVSCSMLFAQQTQTTNDLAFAQDDTIIIQINDDISVTFSFDDIEDLERLLDEDLEDILKDMEDIIDIQELDSMTTITIEQNKNNMKITSNTNGEETIINIDDDDYNIKNKSNNFDPIFYSDLGMNNYLENGKFPGSTDAQYTVKPWGSWSFDLGGGANLFMANKHLSLMLGADFLWYNFKYQDRTTRLYEDDINETIAFTNDTSIMFPTRSKLTVNYINVLFMPMVHFGKYDEDYHGRMFRFGLGGYAGYRINSFTKYVDEDTGEKNKLKYHDNFYLNDFRYGVKVVLGISSINIFGMYDISTLYSNQITPKLNPISFGLNITI